jgi:hypothetical protein
VPDEVLATDAFHPQSGGTYHSSGTFTINSAKAREKLRDNLFQDPSDCLLKLVQAAVGDGAAGIRISIGRKGFDFTAVGVSGLGPGALLAMDEHVIFGSPLCQAVHSLAPLCESLRYETAEPGCKWRLDVLKETRHSETFQGGRYWSVSTNRPTSFLSSIKNRFALHGALKRCLFCPVPIRVSGRELNDPYPDRSTRPLIRAPILPGLATRHFGLLERYDLPNDLREHSETILACSVRSRRSYYYEPVRRNLTCINDQSTCNLHGKVFYHWVEGPGSKREVDRPLHCSRVIQIPVHLKGPARWSVIDRGVVVETLEGDLGCPGAQIVDTLRGLQTDLSGFSLIRNDQFYERANQNQEALKACLRKIDQHTHLLPSVGLHGYAADLPRYVEEKLRECRF